MQNPQPTDTELVLRARRGDMDAYAELVRRYQDQALATAYFSLGDRSDEVVGLMLRLRGVDYGPYAHGYRIEQLGPDEVRVIPTPSRTSA